MNSLTNNPEPKKYVIQRSSETLCEWWTGTEWSQDWSRAACYDEKPDTSIETGSESAKAMLVKDANVTPKARDIVAERDSEK